jgi:hypothetical protein
MEVNLIGSLAIGLVVLLISILIIRSLGYEIQISFVRKMNEVFSNLYSQIFGRGYYNVCEVYDDEYISFSDFKTLLNAIYNKKCGDSKINVILSFSLREEDIKELAKELDLAKNGELIYQGSANEPLGMGVILIHTTPRNEFLFKSKDEVTLWNEGEPDEDTLISLTGQNCDIYEKTCDPGTGYIPPTFTILYIQLDGDVPNFQTKAEDAKDFWIEKTPLFACPERVDFIAVSDKICNIPDQNDICNGPNPSLTGSETMSAIANCVNSWGYSGDYTRVVGVLPGSEICSNSQGSVNGYTYINYEFAISTEDSLSFTGTHELAHTFGLCDEGYGNCVDNTCPSGLREGDCDPGICYDVSSYCCPNGPNENSIMCTTDQCGRGCNAGLEFGSDARIQLESRLNSYCR